MKKTIVRIGCVMLAAALIAGCIIAYAETADKPSDTVKVVQTAEPEVETDNLTERNDEYRIPTIVRDYINVTNAENGCLAAPANYQVDCWDTPIDLRADMTVLMIKGHITGNFEVYAARDNGVETVWPLVVAEVMVDEVLSVPSVEAPNHVPNTAIRIRATIITVRLESRIAVNPREKPFFSAPSIVRPAFSSSLILSAEITFASTPIPIDRIIPAIPGSVSEDALLNAKKPVIAANIPATCPVSAITATKPGSL